jgi:transcriptional regulator with XRE-family HTH domain
MDFDGARLKALRELKGIHSQQALADLVGLPPGKQPYICDLEKGRIRNQDLFLKVADALDCETDFLYARGRFKNIDLREGSIQLREAASEMAFVFFVEREIDERWRIRCRRVRGHKAAPITADAWCDLAEQMDLACGTNGGSHLKAVPPIGEEGVG